MSVSNFEDMMSSNNYTRKYWNCQMVTLTTPCHMLRVHLYLSNIFMLWWNNYTWNSYHSHYEFCNNLLWQYKKLIWYCSFLQSQEIQSRDWSKHSYPNDILSGYKMASSKFSRNMSASRQNVHLLLVACSVFMLLMLSSMLPQTRAVLSGTGGVFNSPEAQEYWNRRYKLMIFYFQTLLLQC